MRVRTALLQISLPLGLVALGFTIPNAHAQTNSWINSTTGFWQDATNWSLGLPPDSTQSMLITNVGNKTVLVDSSTSAGYSNTLTASDVILAGQAGAENTLLVDNIGSNPPLHVLNSLIVNPGGSLLSINSALLVDNAAGGAVDIEGTLGLSGTNFLSGGLYVGFSTNSTASVSVIDGTTAFTNGYMTIGFYGSAELTLLGGTLQAEDDITITNGLLVGPGSAPNGLFVGFGPASQGTLSIPGGTLLVPEHLSLGEDGGATGLLSLNGGQVIATNNYLVCIGGNGAGQVVISNSPVAASYLIIGDALGSSGTLTVAGGTVNLSGAMVVAQGQSSTGSVFITSGQLLATNSGGSVYNSEYNPAETAHLSVTIGGFGVGQMTLSNGSFLAQSVIVGDCENSLGTLTIAGGSASVSSNMIVGANAYLGSTNNANASGAVQITGGSLTITNQFGTGLLNISQQGSGSFVQDGGSVQVDQLAVATASGSYLVIPRNTNVFFGGVGQVILSNGVLLARTVTLGVSSNCQGSLTVAGGSISVSSNIVAGIGSNTTCAIQLLAGNLAVTNQSATGQLVIGQHGTATFLQSGGTATVDQLLITNSGSAFSLNSGVFNTRSTTISNAQTIFIGDDADPATYHLLGGVHSFANGIEVRSNAVLSGCGTINGAVLVDPGGLVLADCGGTLTFTGTLTNNGVVEAANGSTVESYGSVVNNGVINIIDGNTNFHAGFINNGTILTSNSVPQIVSITAVGLNIQVQFTTASNLTYVLEYTGSLPTENWTPLVGLAGLGGNVTVTDYNAILQTQRFYRVRLILSP